MKVKLNAEIQINRPANNFLIHFRNANVVQTEIASLGANSNIEAIKKLGSFIAEDETKLAALIKRKEELIALNTAKKITELQNLLNLLYDFIAKINSGLDFFKAEDIKNYNQLIDLFHTLKELAK